MAQGCTIQAILKAILVSDFKLILSGEENRTRVITISMHEITPVLFFSPDALVKTYLYTVNQLLKKILLNLAFFLTLANLAKFKMYEI